VEESPLIRVAGNGRLAARRLPRTLLDICSPIRTLEPAMTRTRLTAVALCAAALLAAPPLAALAVDAAATGRPPTSPDQPKPRVGSYKIVKRGVKITHAKCLEGGNVAVPTREKATAAQRDRDIHDACKTLDYTK
jgi:hypothetical protein